MKAITLNDLLLSTEDEEKNHKPIDFVYFVDNDIITEACSKPNEFQKVILLGKNYTGSALDAMWAIENGGEGFFYLGYWNGGVVK